MTTTDLLLRVTNNPLNFEGFESAVKASFGCIFKCKLEEMCLRGVDWIELCKERGQYACFSERFYECFHENSPFMT